MKLSDLHIRKHDDGTYAAIWGPFLLKSGFQPIFKMGNGPTRIGAFEALCRPIRDGMVSSPGKFFPLVPKNESYRVELQTRAVHVLNAPAVLTEREWLFLNFDPSMFTDGATIETALSILDETLLIADVDRSRVVCEVTEHKTSEYNLMELVRQIRARGFRIAVDDFGADHSDMERVRKLAPDIIKFDAYWITKLMDSGSAGADLLRNMVETFKDRRITTLFEGIEHGWQLDLAVDCGVEFVQGFVLAHPQTVPSDFHAFRSKQNMSAAPREGHFQRDQSLRPEFIQPHYMPAQPALRARLNALNAWENEMAAAMETPSLAPAATDIYRLAQPAPSNPNANVAPPVPLKSVTPAYSPPTEIRQGSFTPAFGPRGGSFGQKR